MRRQDFSLFKAQQCGKDSIFVEIGTWEGDFAIRLLENTNCKKLYCVDPYKHFDDDVYPDAINSHSQEKLDEIYQSTKRRLEKYGDRVEFIRLCSADAVNLFDDESIDFVYIDGNHEYKYVEEDIRLWYSKVKKDGFLCGDDVWSLDLLEHDIDNNILKVWTRYPDGSPACWGKYGTYPACLKNEKLYNIKFTFEDTQFSYRKI